jgi:hypothetical protein
MNLKHADEEKAVHSRKLNANGYCQKENANSFHSVQDSCGNEDLKSAHGKFK